MSGYLIVYGGRLERARKPLDRCQHGLPGCYDGSRRSLMLTCRFFSFGRIVGGVSRQRSTQRTVSGIRCRYICFHLSGLSNFGFPEFQENEAAGYRSQAVSERPRMGSTPSRRDYSPTGRPPHFPQRSLRTRSPQCLQNGIVP
jgi:hypothetical protein